jgi:hypothetical protein
MSQALAMLNACSEISSGSAGTFAPMLCFTSAQPRRTAMKKFGYIIAAVAAMAIAAPSIASAEKIVIKEGRGHHHGYGARAEMHRGYGWHRHHDSKVVIVKHRHGGDRY